MGYPGKGRADHLELGDWNAQCYQCGRKRKASTLMRHWQGYWVCPEHWEARHPQDFVRGIPDVVTPPWTQPWPQDAYAINVVNLGPDDSGTYTLPATASGAVIINILEGCSITSLDLSAGTAAVTSVVVNVGGSLGPVTLAGVGGASDPEINVQDGGEYDPGASAATGIVFRAWEAGHAGSILYATIDWAGNLLYAADVSAMPYAAGYLMAGLGQSAIVLLGSNIYKISPTYATEVGPTSITGYGGITTLNSAQLLKITELSAGFPYAPTGVTLDTSLVAVSTKTALSAVTPGTVGFNARPDQWQVSSGIAYIDLGVVAGVPKFAAMDLTTGAVTTTSYLSGEYTYYYSAGSLYLANFCVNSTTLFRILANAQLGRIEVVSLATGVATATVTVTSTVSGDAWRPLGLCCDEENLLVVMRTEIGAVGSTDGLIVMHYDLPDLSSTNITTAFLAGGWSASDVFDAMPGTRMVPLF